MAIGMTMFLPGLAGNWLDARLGTSFLGLLGIAAGLGVAFLWLTQLKGAAGRSKR
jgi:hypothetical protein